MRKNKQFFQLAKRLDEELNKSFDIFLKGRPFLEDLSLEPIIQSSFTDDEIEEKITNEFTTQKIIKGIQAIA